MEQNYKTSPPSQEAVNSAKELYNAVHIRFSQIISTFESRWTAWQEVCPPAATSSMLKSTKTDEYQSLKSLGPKIIPLVVYKLATNIKQNFLGVLLYNELESKPQWDDLPDCRVTWNDDVVNEETLRGLGNHIVEKNYERSLLLEERIANWKKHNDEYSWGSSSTMYTNCDEYEYLLELGPSIIAACMIEYVNIGVAGWWWQLVHELIHGEKLVAHMIDRKILYEETVKWFNMGEHAEAPKYVQTPWDRKILHGEDSDIVRQYRKQGKVPPTWAEMRRMEAEEEAKKEVDERDGRN